MDGARVEDLGHELDDYFWATRTAMAAEEVSTAHILIDERPGEDRP